MHFPLYCTHLPSASQLEVVLFLYELPHLVKQLETGLFWHRLPGVSIVNYLRSITVEIYPTDTHVEFTFLAAKINKYTLKVRCNAIVQTSSIFTPSTDCRDVINTTE